MQHSDAVVSVHDELVHLIRQLITRTDSGSLTFAQHSVLSYIERNPGCRATQIAESFGVHRSTISRQIRSGVDSGWVSAEPGPVRSGNPLTLTEAGERTLADADDSRLTDVGHRVRDWRAEDVEQFAQMLHRFRVTSPVPDIDTSGGDSNA